MPCHMDRMLSLLLCRKFRNRFEEKEKDHEEEDHNIILPDDMIQEILSRLPVKSLLRFRCVSKSWLNLISTRAFINLHMHRWNENHDYVLIKGSEGMGLVDCVTFSSFVVSDYPFAGGSHFHSWWLSCSCDGLVCLVDDHKETWLWNPSTRRHRRLPSGNRCESDQCYLCALGSGCDKCFPSALGLGYDPSSNDYLIIRVFGQSDVEIYSLNKSSWTVMKSFPYRISSYEGPTLLDGVLHWVGSYHPHKRWKTTIIAFDITTRRFQEIQLPNDDPDYKRSSVDIAFDIKIRKFREIKLPDDPYHDRGTVAIMVLNGCLAIEYSIWCMDLKVYFVDIWMMKEYGLRESWVKLITVMSEVHLLGISQEVELMGFYSTRRRLCLCDPKKQASRDIKIKKFPHVLTSKGLSFVESIVSL